MSDTKTDVEKAKQYREEIMPILQQAVDIVNRAKKDDGLRVDFGFGRLPNDGPLFVVGITVVRDF